MKPDDRVNILVVDDSPPKLLAYAALLSDLEQNVVTATSGRDALRFLLNQEFAVILLDVNMPGMDGFETAALIRQRKSSEHTPIIFVTSYGDEHAAHGYSLGAVDYILAPVQPEVLRTKVGVFVELYSKAAQVRLQARALEGRALRLQKLTEASLAINSARSVDGILRAAAGFARDILEAHQSVASSASEAGSPPPASATSLSPEFEPGGARTVVRDAPRLLERLLQGRRALRLPASPESDEPGWEGIFVHPRPPGGWIAAPFAAGDGRGLGLLRVFQKREGDFTDEDEELLTQLAQMSSIAIENIHNAEAREANRLKDEFLATLSHELRTPLSAILGWTRTLREGTIDTERATHGLQVIERNVLAQTKLIDDLLDVSRIIAGKLSLNVRPMRIAAVIETAIDAMRPLSQARDVPIRFENRVPSGADATAGDPDRVQQVVWNLLSNAIKFTPSGGRVDVRLALVLEGFEISVQDTGRGIRPEFLAHVFERFRQGDSSTTRAQGGLGIGLAISRHLVELHGGAISAASDGENRGATFRVTFPPREVPAGTEPDGPPETAPSERPWPALSGLRVLVVEDEPDGRELLVETLQLCGAEVAEAPSARAALRIFDTFRPDVVVTDIGMPGEDGYSLLRRLRQLPAGASVPVIAVTAYARPEDRARALESGFQAHVAKPFEPVELAAVVERFSRSAYRSSAPPVEKEDGVPAGEPAPRGGGEAAPLCRVLVVEDDADSREALRRLLELWGHPVEVVEGAAGAVEMALEARPDVALIDIGLSDLDGYEVARRLRGALPGNGLFLVAMTGYVDSRDRQLAAEAGFHAHLAKPIDPSKLKALLASRPSCTSPSGEGETMANEIRPRA